MFPFSSPPSSAAMEQEASSPFRPSFIFILALLMLAPSLAIAQRQCSVPGEVRAGYWLATYSRYSPLSAIDGSLYTHLYFYSLPMDFASLTAVDSPADGAASFATFSGIVKSSNPSLQTILSISTDDQDMYGPNATFSEMIGDPDRRAKFINFTLELARGNGFDGVDLAWRFPSTAADMANLGTLLSEWRDRIDAGAELKPSQPVLLLTATVYFSNHVFDTLDQDVNYPIDVISYSLDWANVLTFGLHKSSNFTVLESPLYCKTSHFSASYGMISWIDAGVPACKLVMGIPLFGRSWFLKNKDRNGLGAPVVSAGPRLKLSNQTGIMAYSEIEGMMNGTTSVLTYENQSVSAFISSSDLWVTFDSLEVVEKKIRFAMQNSMLGYFLWPVSFDDANFSVSKQASTIWSGSQDPFRVHDDIGIEQVDAQQLGPPASNSTANHSAASSASTKMFLNRLRYCHSFALLSFSFFWVTSY